jgi:hypothetical protein
MEKNHCKLANWDVPHLANAPHRAVENAAKKIFWQRAESALVRATQRLRLLREMMPMPKIFPSLQMLHPRARSYRGGIARYRMRANVTAQMQAADSAALPAAAL